MTYTNENTAGNQMPGQVSLSLRFYRSADGGNIMQQARVYASAAMRDNTNTELMLSQHSYKKTGELVEKAMRRPRSSSLHQLRSDVGGDPSAAVAQSVRDLRTASIVAVTHGNRIKEVLAGKLGEQLGADKEPLDLDRGGYVDFEITMPADLEIDAEVERLIQRNLEQTAALRQIEKTARKTWKGLSDNHRASLDPSEDALSYYVGQQERRKARGAEYDEAAEPLLIKRSQCRISGYFDKLADALGSDKPLADQGIEVKAQVVNAFKTLEL